MIFTPQFHVLTVLTERYCAETYSFLLARLYSAFLSELEEFQATGVLEYHCGETATERTAHRSYR